MSSLLTERLLAEKEIRDNLMSLLNMASLQQVGDTPFFRDVGQLCTEGIRNYLPMRRFISSTASGAGESFLRHRRGGDGYLFSELHQAAISSCPMLAFRALKRYS
jgi:hypothetical protein